MQRGHWYPYVRQRDWWFRGVKNTPPPPVSWYMFSGAAGGPLAAYWTLPQYSGFATYDIVNSIIAWEFPTPTGSPVEARLQLEYRTISPPGPEPGRLWARTIIDGVTNAWVDNYFFNYWAVENSLIWYDWPIYTGDYTSGLDLYFDGSAHFFPRQYPGHWCFPPRPY